MSVEIAPRDGTLSHPAGKRPIHPLTYALVSGFTLLKHKPVDRFRDTYWSIARQPEETFSLNREEQLLPDLLGIVENRDVRLGTLSPYWSPQAIAHPLEVLGTLAQFADYHDLALPKEVFPPEVDIKEYIERVMRSEGKVTIPQQLEHLLEITDNNLLGAMHLGFIASRVMARGLEARPYPGFHIEEVELLAWNNKISQFEKYTDLGKNDAPGDTYYFWTQMYGTAYFRLYEGFGKAGYDFAVEHATEIMRFVRKRFTSMPTVSSHQEATLLGRQLGLALVESLSQTKPINASDWKSSFV